ncbi:PLP-dependent aspartate aminotransferase family protein [Buttiauxella sp. A2-C2_NF]|nr:PLP-dependent aspartate aminotransferase family protein [Buttiauxella ferragutiae]
MTDKSGSDESRYFPHPAIRRFTSGIYQNYEALERASQDLLKMQYPRYSRFGTPMTDAVEQEITRLEGGYCSVSTCSGLAAITSVLMTFLRPGDHILLTRSVYEPVRRFVTTYLASLGINATFISANEFSHCEDYLTDKTKLIYIESPSSNIFEVTDIDIVTAIARQKGVLTVMDNTWSTPLLLNPLCHGVDIVVHSASKYLTGHSDAVIGIITTTERYYLPVRQYLMTSGMCAGGEESSSLYKGLKTLASRLKSQRETAQQLIAFLRRHPAIETVISPDLTSHPDHKTFMKYYQHSNGLFSFAIRKPSDARRDAFLNEFRTVKLAYGWGGVDSCLVPFTPSESPPCGSEMIFFRVSIGLEDRHDLITEFSSALSRL